MNDTELLDYLERLNEDKEYTGRCILRLSSKGQGWRLQETDREGSSKTVREAIEKFAQENIE